MLKKNSVMLIVLLAVSFVGAQQSTKVVVETFHWEDGYHNVFLQAGTYYFTFSGAVTTDIPFDDSNTWNNCAIFEDGTYNYSQYGCSGWEVTNGYFGDSTATFSVPVSGTYSIKAGSYEIWGCTINSNTAKLIRLHLYNNN
ncbi:MAG: hypothetical protein U9N34_04965 [Candidatus Cloacimonadota bacterium]|nr:hypothetical protein [Candidatus Cloacimonadota bacterium]